MSGAGDLIALLPRPMFENAALMHEAMTTVGTEVDLLRAAIHAFRVEMFPQIAEGVGLDEWEQELGLAPDARLTVQERRERLMALLLGSGTSTVEKIREVIAAFEYGTVQIIEDFAHYTVNIRFIDVAGVPARLDEVFTAIRRVLPAHLLLQHEIIYTTWDNLDAAGLTWDQFDSLGLTWDQLSTYHFSHIAGPGAGGHPANPDGMLTFGAQQAFVPFYVPSEQDISMLGAAQPPVPV